MNTNLKGTITELKCQLYFLNLGYTVSVPINPERYDMVLDTGEQLLKIQIKTCNNNTEGVLTFSTCSSHYVQGKHVHTSYKEDNIDYFMTYWDDKYYLIPIEECGAREKTLRLIPPKNGQIKGISFAKDYIAEEVLKKR